MAALPSSSGLVDALDAMLAGDPFSARKEHSDMHFPQSMHSSAVNSKESRRFVINRIYPENGLYLPGYPAGSRNCLRLFPPDELLGNYTGYMSNMHCRKWNTHEGGDDMMSPI